MALAMGARVIAMGRNLDAVKRIAGTNGRIEAVQITGDVQTDTKALQSFGNIDAFFDISPPAAANSTHIKSGILALKPSGRVSLMGGIQGDILIPHSVVMHKNLQIKGKWMYNREDIGALIKMIEIGVLKLGEHEGVKIVGKFGLDEWENAFAVAAENPGMGKQTLIVP